jgi:phage terminase Nu1 subunit (DNA packaging protein)
MARKKTLKTGPTLTANTDVTRNFLARLLGVDVRTITNCRKENAPQSARGLYPLADFVMWYVQREREAARGAKGLNDLDLARQRKTIADARLAELTLAKEESRVIPIELHQQRLRERLETVAGNVKAIGRYQPHIKAAVTDEAADVLCDRMSDEILAELYDLKDTID